jgi:hypothetical protein
MGSPERLFGRDAHFSLAIFTISGRKTKFPLATRHGQE